MSINGNRIVGPVEGVDCVLAARTLSKTLNSNIRTFYTFVEYPGVGYVWIPKGFLQTMFKHVCVDPATFKAKLLDYRMQESTCDSLGKEFTDIGKLVSSGSYLDVATSQDGHPLQVLNKTQGKIFAGQWYRLAQGSSVVKIRTLKPLGIYNGVFSDFDHTVTEIIDAEISFVPYTRDISMFDGTSGCSFTDDKTIAMRYFDGWATRDATYKQKSCTGDLRDISQNCLFIGSIEGKTPCNSNFGYAVDDSCDVLTYGNCETGTCARTNTLDGFSCQLPYTPPLKSTTEPASGRRGKETFIAMVILGILAFLLLLGIIAKNSKVI